MSKIKGYDVNKITHWEVPVGDDLRPLITMPNIPKPLHGSGCQPRTILKASTWDHMRKACYANAGYKCEICGAEVDVDIKKRQLHAHEAYNIDYKAGTSTFVRCIAACARCHLGGIHTGRAITLYKHGNPLYPKEFLLEGAENAFRLIYEYNKDNPGARLRAYATFLEYLKQPELKGPMEELIKKYDMKFYVEDEKKMADWADWKLIIGNKEYPTPYKNEADWKKAMEKQGEHDTARQLEEKVKETFSGEVYNEIDEILKEEKKDGV